MHIRLTLILWLLFTGSLSAQHSKSQSPANMVNVFMGSSGDHGQMSPGASYPFGLLDICPQTYPNLHTGYEHKAKTFLGFTHNRFEGVGCQGSGGNILIKPFLGTDPQQTILNKSTETGGAGFYQVAFTNRISVKIAVNKNTGVEEYHFPQGKKGFWIDLSHTLANHFVAEEHQLSNNGLNGWIDSRTTCNVGTYRVYYHISFDQPVSFSQQGDHHLMVYLKGVSYTVKLTIGMSAVDEKHAKNAIANYDFEHVKRASTKAWNKLLNGIEVEGDAARKRLFYSLLYRTVQSPYLISEPDGAYRATNGNLEQSNKDVYNGWAIWDNYRTQLPLLSILDPDRFSNMVSSIAALFKNGKKDYATQHEPSNTVRTEHAIVVLLDAYRKGYPVDFNGIKDSLIADVDRLDYSHPDKALESSYDTWALSQILAITGDTQLSVKYLQKASAYKDYWKKDFEDLTKPDVDRVSARSLYQGTIWQYRWFVPFDLKGLIALTGGEQAYLHQLDQFFDNDYYNQANEPDIQAPMMYNVTSESWKSQALVHKYAVDTVVQYYFNDNSRGVDPFVDVIYQNKPDTYVRTMDDDAGAMSAWYIFAACGLSPACVGWPVYYISAPLLKQVTLNRLGLKSFKIKTLNYSLNRRYIQSVTLNGKPLNRNWITQKEIMQGGTLTIKLKNKPNKTFGTTDQWISDINMKPL